MKPSMSFELTCQNESDIGSGVDSVLRHVKISTEKKLSGNIEVRQFRLSHVVEDTYYV